MKQIKWYNCGEQFSAHWNLMKHRKIKHTELTRICSNYISGKCQYTADVCWWRHEDSGPSSNPFNCRICEKELNSKGQLMSHRIADHENLCRPCTNYAKGGCKFETKCWYRHGNDNAKTLCEYGQSCKNIINKPGCPYDHEVQQVFQNAPQKTKPPLVKLAGKNKKQIKKV